MHSNYFGQDGKIIPITTYTKIFLLNSKNLHSSVLLLPMKLFDKWIKLLSYLQIIERSFVSYTVWNSTAIQTIMVGRSQNKDPLNVARINLAIGVSCKEKKYHFNYLYPLQIIKIQSNLHMLHNICIQHEEQWLLWLDYHKVLLWQANFPILWKVLDHGWYTKIRHE